MLFWCYFDDVLVLFCFYFVAIVVLFWCYFDIILVYSINVFIGTTYSPPPSWLKPQDMQHEPIVRQQAQASNNQYQNQVIFQYY